MITLLRPKTIADIAEYAKEMFVTAKQFPVTTHRQYSKDQAEALKKTESLSEEEQKEQIKFARYLEFDPISVVSLVLTYECQENQPPHFRLSMSRCSRLPGQMFIEIPDNLAAVILEQFFGDKGIAVPNPSPIQNVKHFVMYE
jgi:hypothetical protein